MHYIGLMSGTSADAIDAVAVSIPEDGAFRLLASHAHPIPSATRQAIHTLTAPGPDEIDRLGALHTELGELFAEAALAVLAKTALTVDAIHAIGSHGQTVRHRPATRHPFSLQIGNPAVIAERTRITTVADFRARDIAAGGHGAPLVPAFHREMFHGPGKNRAIVNIGGIANVTFLPADSHQPVTGFDTGPGNTLLDAWARRHLGKDRDEDGRWAAGGKSSNTLLEKLLAEAYFNTPPPKSTGREQFHLAWLDAALTDLPAGPPSPQDVQATLLRFTAQTIARALERFLPKIDEIYVCGGGSHNPALLKALAHETAGPPIRTTDALGLHPDWVEASAFAWLAHRALRGQAGNLPSVTGARHPVILGAIYKA
jgi:anhydro-N-acetylmuramic acid kinase